MMRRKARKNFQAPERGGPPPTGGAGIATDRPPCLAAAPSRCARAPLARMAEQQPAKEPAAKQEAALEEEDEFEEFEVEGEPGRRALRAG